MLIDTHAHLTDERYKDIDAIINNFEKDNLLSVFCVGYDVNSSKQCIALSEKHDRVYAIIGVHPSDIESLNDEAIAFLENFASHEKVIAIGEIGLDYHYPPFNKELQAAGFVKQMEIANKNNLPIVIHTRDATGDLLQMLKQHSHLINNGGIVHCFSDTLETYAEIEKLHLKVSLGGALTFHNAKELQQVAKHIPLNNILLETDCPYLTPVPFRGKELNQPKFVLYVAKKLAELKNISEEEVMTTTTNNAYSLFKKVKR